MRKILCIGPQWRGSNAGGLFRALSRVGNLISIVDENYYLNLSDSLLATKIADKCIRSLHIKEFNHAILLAGKLFKPDLVLVYKGAFLLPETIISLKSLGLPVVNFYPDVSFRTHGSLLSRTLPLYDHVFTTKTFGIQDMKDQLGIVNSSFIPHGFDPDIHKYIDATSLSLNPFSCEVSFIGGWSEKKEQLLSAVKRKRPSLDIKIWGGRWEACSNKELDPHIQHMSILGDLYAMGISSSKINLGLLHERVDGASSGDLITSRTFHIPGAGGFMIHERTDELQLYFEEGKEVVCFESEEELVEKVVYFIENDDERRRIAEAGHLRALRDHSLDNRARTILNTLE